MAQDAGTEALGLLDGVAALHRKALGLSPQEASVPLPPVPGVSSRISKKVNASAQAGPGFSGAAETAKKRPSNVVVFHAGNLVFRENDPGKEMYIVLAGEVEIIKMMKDGTGKVLLTVGKGDFFGEMALIDQKPRSAHAICKTNVTLLKINDTILDRFIEKNPKFGIKMIRAFSGRLRNANRIIEQAMVGKPQDVVYNGLADYARDHGQAVPEGVRVDLRDFSVWANYHLAIPELSIPYILDSLSKSGLILIRGRDGQKAEIVIKK